MRLDINTSFTSAGFGLGIDDADEDDMDIYHTESSRAEHGGRTAYDLDEHNDDVVLLGPGVVGADKARRGIQRSAEEGRISKRPPLRETSREGHVWSDGKPVLPGFVIDPSATAQDKW